MISNLKGLLEIQYRILERDWWCGENCAFSITKVGERIMRPIEVVMRL